MALTLTATATALVSGLVVLAGLIGSGAGAAISLDRASTDAQVAASTAADRADHDAMIGSQIASLSAGRSCTKEARLSPVMLVANAPKDRAGVKQFDTAVVRVVSWDAGFKDAEAGRVFVLRYCS